ncbi:MAG: SUMF1/EgtB/PvdO family nonheme iron enzyme, partial [Caldilinea sp.]
DTTARLLAAHVDIAVGVEDDIDDAAFQHFTPSLYAALADGRSIPNAVEIASQELRNRAAYAVYAGMIHFYVRSGVDANDLAPVRWLASDPPRQPPPISPLHRQYLAKVCATMKRVNLANILETQRREPELLDIYVPLPVDATVVVEIERNQVKDWWLHTGGGGSADAPERDARFAEAGELDEKTVAGQRPKSWPALSLQEPALAPLIQFVRNKVAAGELSADKANARWQIDAEQAASLQPRMVLIGDPGSGKSSFLRHLALCLAGESLRRAGDATTPGKAGLAQLAGWLAPPDLTPIYIELRSLVDGFPPLPEPEDALALPQLPSLSDHFWPYVQEQVLDARLADFVRELETLCLDGKAILFLDGLDEVSQAETAERRQQLHDLIQQLTDTYPKIRIVVGSRPYAYEVGDWSLDGFGQAHLIRLPDERLQRLADQLFTVLAGPGEPASQAKRFLDALRGADLDRSMVANPLYFTLWLALWHSTPAPHRLPATTRAGLYGAAVDLLLTRWFRRKSSEIEKELGVPAERLRPVLETLACNLLADERRQDGNRFEFHIAELDAVLRDARAGHRREFSRLDLDRVDAFLAQHAGLLALVSPRPNHYRFLHASFQEYLAACELTCPEPTRRVPPVAPARHFPDGLLQQVWAQPDAWWNATHLAADQLLTTGRKPALWRLLAEMCAPYVADGERARTALLAMEIVNKLPPGDLPVALLLQVMIAAQQILVDLDHVPNPAQRLIAGDALARLGDPRPGVGVQHSLPDIAWVKIPEFGPDGRREFLYHDGTRNTQHDGLYTFWIARYPITYAQFQAFVDAPDGYRNQAWRKGLADYFGEDGTRWEQRWPLANRPRERVSWPEAVAFCRWLTTTARRQPELLPDASIQAQLDQGWSIRLPTEQEWVKAARGWDDRLYPWGRQEYKSGYANVDETEGKVGSHYLQQSSPVGIYPQGASPFGVEEMSGNVWEVCLNKHDNPDDLSLSGDDGRAMRGGSLYDDSVRSSVAARVRDLNINDGSGGFRVVSAASH